MPPPTKSGATLSDALLRGDVVRVRPDPVEGSEQAVERPALVLSPDLINLHSPVILVAPISSRKTNQVYPFEAVIEPPDGGLAQRSKVMLMQMRVVDRRRVVGRYGRISPSTQDLVDAALKIATGLTRLS